jgi:GWxTD domain-containing protein
MKLLLWCIVSAGAVNAAAPDWLERVEPIISPAEKKVYLSLEPAARAKFEDDFWTGKAITSAEYEARLAYADSAFGSGRTGSGANTDQGRVWLSLGAPSRITRLPSSRVFVPLEIWYYDSVPSVLNTELRLIFYQKRNVGVPKLYSPSVDTIRALLLPQSSTRTMFGPNDGLTESDIRKVLKVGPAEDEVITASVAVATGIKYTGNDEIIGRIASPREMLGKPQRTDVRSRLILARPKLDVVQTASPYGGAQVDFRLETKARSEIAMEVIEGAATVYQNQLHFRFSNAEPVAYTHRIDLLPGSYRVVFSVDRIAFPYVVEVAPRPSMGEIFRANLDDVAAGRRTPFEFDGRQFELSPEGQYAFVAIPKPGPVTWMIRQGAQVIWKSTSSAGQIASVDLPTRGLAPGSYRLDAVTPEDSRTIEFVWKNAPAESARDTVISFNANLAPASRLAAIGHQWLLRGNLVEARRTLAASLEKGRTDQAEVELARVDALAGDLDAARDRVRKLLAARPNHFEALSVLAYIEAKFQDYAVAADLYRRALAVQDSPALRAALAQLPHDKIP